MKADNNVRFFDENEYKKPEEFMIFFRLKNNEKLF